MSNIFTVVSVDVIALRYDAVAKDVALSLIQRETEPHAGELALPGVVVLSGESLTHAVQRAMAKDTGATRAPNAVGQLQVFDEPSRDPRGPSMSVAMYAVLPHSDGPFTETRVRYRDARPSLAFDHTHILEVCRPLIAARLWNDQVFTRALMPAEFGIRDAIAVTAALTGQEPHRGNLNRTLARFPGLEVQGTRPGGIGRPATWWRFID